MAKGWVNSKDEKLTKYNRRGAGIPKVGKVFDPEQEAEADKLKLFEAENRAGLRSGFSDNFGSYRKMPVRYDEV